MANENKLDQFYTNDKIAEWCFKKLLEIMNISNAEDYFFVEPSAGGGAFLRQIQTLTENYFASDIEPHCDGIEKLDYLSTDISSHLPKDKTIIVVGNPPFGKRSRLALNFINRSFRYSDIVGFVLPIQFQKYNTQKQVDENALLVFDEILPKDSFLHKDKPYDVRCCFQIWQKNTELKNLRLGKFSTETTHPDFELWQYNNSPDALKYFNHEKYPWDFAVVRQGYNDFSKKYYPSYELDRKKQWIFFKANNREILTRLLQLDFVKLSQKNTSTPGFGKADVIEEYNKLYPQNTIDNFF